MHEHAELGVAAHWTYKEGGSRDSQYERKIEWVRKLLEPHYEIAYDEPTMHECVFSDARQDKHGIDTGAIAKRLNAASYST